MFSRLFGVKERRNDTATIANFRSVPAAEKAHMATISVIVHPLSANEFCPMRSITDSIISRCFISLSV